MNDALQRDLFRAAFERAADAMVILGDDRRVSHANAAMGALLGVAPAFLVGRRLGDLAPDARVDEAWDALLSAGSARGDWLLQSDGGRREVEFVAVANVVEGSHLAVLRDVTEERRLLASEQQLGMIAETLEEGLVLATLDGRVVWADSRCYELLDRTPDELLGNDFVASIFSAEQAEQMREQLKRRAKGISERYELDVPRRDGTSVPVAVTALPVRDDSGEVVASLGVGLDLRGRRGAERERAQLERQLRIAQRMQAIGRLAGGVAHDFNNLLTVILGNTHELVARASGDVAEGLHEIEAAAQRARALTGQLLSVAGRQPSAARPLSLNAEIAQIAPIVARLAGNEIDVELMLDPAVRLVLADPGRLERVVLNLVANARDAMPEGGSLTIVTRGSPGPSLGSPGRVILEVSDTGAGMDDETRERIFDPFFTTKSAGKGTGLGLSIVYGIVLELGGEIAADSAPGKGTCFRIDLPEAPGDESLQAPPAQPVAGSEAPSGGDRTVLVVDDDDGVRRLIQRTLVGTGYRVLEAMTPEEALDLLRNACLEVDLMLTDVVMPRMDGFELAEQARRLVPALRVAYLSGYAAPAEGASNGSVEVLSKPFAPRQLLEHVRAALG